MSKITLHAFITGRVQGVFYRDSTRSKAQELNLTGWTRNLNDGRVEVFACGEKEKILILKDWLWQGPPAASVTEVTWEELPWQHFDDFKIITTK